jgi:Tfp pilus assembly PilM family ATPase
MITDVRHSPIINTRNALGIDIGSSSIKVVELRPGIHKPILETYGMIELHAYEAKKKNEENPEVGMDPRAIALLDLLHEIGTTTRRAGLSLPLSSVFVSLIETVKRDEHQLRQIIETEARRYVPVDLNTVSIVWQSVPEPVSPTGAFAHAETVVSESAHPMKILLAAASKDTLGAYERIAREAELEVPFFEPEVFSALRGVPPERGAPYLFIDIGTSGSKSYIADEHGNALATHYLETGKSSDTVTKTTENALRMVHEYNGAHPTKIGACILSGAGARNPDMSPFIKHKIGLPVTIANPFTEIQTPMILEDVLQDVGPLYTVACGLALRTLTQT